MRIESVHIKHFRAIKDCEIKFDDYTCLVGANGVGKSTILSALNVFFGHQEGAATNIKKLSEEDFFQKDVSEPIEIKVTFSELSEQALEDFQHYVRGGKLIVIARATFSEGEASIKQHGLRMVIDDFRPFFEASKASEKNAVYSSLRDKYGLEKITGMAKQEAALRQFESENTDLCVEVESEEAFYGVSRGSDRLEKHVQWVYVPAVKDASQDEIEGKSVAVSKLLDRAVRSKVDFKGKLDTLREQTLEQYNAIVESEGESLTELSESLQKRLQAWGSPKARLEVSWFQDDKKFKIEQPQAKVSTGEQGFLGSLARMGHGLQRSYIISLLEELAALDEEDSPTLILGIEEPELYQHPPQAKHLAHVLQKLSEKNTQIISATHSPYFVSGRGFEAVRLIRRNENQQAYCCSLDFPTMAQKQAELTGKAPVKPVGMRALLDPLIQPHISELLFAEKLVLVEGLEDLSILSAWIELQGLGDRFREKGISIVAVNGKSELLRPAIIAKELEIPTLVILDADGECKEDYKPDNETDNSRLIAWSGQAGLSSFPKDPVLKSNIVIWPNNIHDSIFANEDPEVLAEIKEIARSECGHVKNLNKNTVFLGELLILAKEKGFELSLLTQVCELICSDEW